MRTAACSTRSIQSMIHEDHESCPHLFNPKMKPLLMLLVLSLCSTLATLTFGAPVYDTTDVVDDHPCCPVCYDTLEAGHSTAVFTENHRRTCQHYTCADCADKYWDAAPELLCPMCRAPFDNVEVVERMYPSSLFRLFDVNQDGELDREELVRGLLLLLPMRHATLRAYVDRNWARWDVFRSGALGRHEFIQVCQDVLDGRSHFSSGLGGHGSGEQQAMLTAAEASHARQLFE